MIIIFFLAVLQIIIEALPISSSGHIYLITFLLQHMGLHHGDGLPSWLDNVLHVPTFIMVALYFRTAWVPLMRHIYTIFKAWKRTNYSYARLRDSHKRFIHSVHNVIAMILVADGITAVCYLFIKVICKEIVSVHQMGMCLAGFIITACILWASRCTVKKVLHLSTLQCAVVIGLVQGLALLPGISRFAITVVTGLMCGLPPRRAFQLSWLLFAPLMVAAFFLGLPMIIQHPEYLQPCWLAGMCGATALSYFLLSTVEWVITRRLLWLFGVYMIVPIGFIFLLVMM